MVGRYQSLKSKVYFGIDFEKVNSANENSKEYVGEFDNNIFTPGTNKIEELIKSKTYYWRVDSVKKGEQ